MGSLTVDTIQVRLDQVAITKIPGFCRSKLLMVQWVNWFLVHLHIIPGLETVQVHARGEVGIHSLAAENTTQNIKPSTVVIIDAHSSSTG